MFVVLGSRLQTFGVIIHHSDRATSHKRLKKKQQVFQCIQDPYDQRKRSTIIELVTSSAGTSYHTQLMVPSDTNEANQHKSFENWHFIDGKLKD